MLTDGGLSCLVLERRKHIGGNAYSTRVGDVDVHKYGAHIFHTDNEEVWDFVNRFASFNSYRHKVLAINEGKMYHLPFGMTTMYELYGVTSKEEMCEIIDCERRIWFNNHERGDNLESFIVDRVGFTAYKRLVKEYTEKQWGVPCNELPSDIIKRLPVRWSFGCDYFVERHQGIPNEGYTNMVRNMLEGVPVLLDTDFIEDMDFWLARARNVIYCGSVDELLGYELGVLKWRSLTFEEKIGESLGTSVINYTDNSPFTRVIDHRHFLGVDVREHVLTYEYPQEWHIGRERFYPVSNEENNALYARYETLLRARYPNIYLGGRLGLYEYLDMDKTIAKAMDFVKRV